MISHSSMTTASDEPIRGPRWAALDGLRGLSVLAVMVNHFTLYGMAKPTGGLDDMFYRAAMAGWCGVDALFVLSGFLITGILLDAKGGQSYFQMFYIRRALRIFPLYYGFLVVAFLVLPFIVEVGSEYRLMLDSQGWYWAYLINVPIAMHGWPDFNAYAHFWSLAVEEQFYLVWPMVVLVLTPRKLMAVCLACLAVSLGARVWLGLAGYSTATLVWTPARLDALAVGAAVALAIRNHQWRLWLGTWKWRIGWLAAMGWAGLFLWRGNWLTEDLAVQTAGFTLLAIFFGSAVAACVTSQSRVGLKWLEHPLLTTFGLYSYAMYVFHHPISLLMQDTLLHGEALPSVFGSQLPLQLVYLTAGIGLSFVLAALSWRYVESPMLQLKSRFPYGRSLS